MWFGEQDDRLIGLAIWGRQHLSGEFLQARVSPVCVLSEPEQPRTCPSPQLGSFRMAREEGTEGLFYGWEDLGLRMARALGHLRLG